MHSTASRLGAMVLVLALLPAAAAQAQIAGSSHDLSSGGTSTYKGSSSQTCIYCHTPHSAGTNDVPLWNRSLPTSGFTMYTSPTLNSTIGTQPGAVSRACLSCHDGVGVPGNYTGVTSATAQITGAANIGTNLGNDHPVAVTVAATPANSDLRARSNWVASLPLFGTGADQLECATCHEPHNRGASGAGHMLRATNAGSALCTTCHIK